MEKYERSSYIELRWRVFPNNPDKDDYLEALKRLRHRMILFKLSYRGQGMGYAFVDLKNRYPEAHEAFIRELES